MLRCVTIEKLAPTGEGIARTVEGVGFVAGALPGEEVEAEVGEVRKRFWKGRVVSLLTRSPLRRSGPHAESCAGCDWSFFDPDAALQARRELFLETMERIGEIPPASFGELPIAPSAAGYRMRNRFHVSGVGPDAAVGYFAPRTHRVEPADHCEALSESMRARLPLLRAALAATGAPATQVLTVETADASRRLVSIRLEKGADRAAAGPLAASLEESFDGIAIEDDRGGVLAARGERRLWLSACGHEFSVTPGVFFQTNRFLVDAVCRDVGRAAAAIAPGRALDLFAGVGLFAGPLAGAGHAVVSVEGSGDSVGLAREAKKRWFSPHPGPLPPGEGEDLPDWQVVLSSALGFLESSTDRFDLVVADPPRAGLGAGVSRALARLAPAKLLYVSCEMPTLARDLAFLLEGGFAIEDARLYDFFPFTHRVEAMVSLVMR